MASRLNLGEEEAIRAELRRIFTAPATPRELAARRMALEDLDRLHAELGPIRGVTIEELLADDVD